MKMMKTRSSDEQIAFALKQAETRTPLAEVIRRMGIRSRRFTCGALQIPQRPVRQL